MLFKKMLKYMPVILLYLEKLGISTSKFWIG